LCDGLAQSCEEWLALQSAEDFESWLDTHLDSCCVVRSALVAAAWTRDADRSGRV
jgi:hypothetical protein